MASVTVSSAVKARLDALKTADSSRNSISEVVQYLLDHHDSHRAWPFYLEDISAAFGKRKGDPGYRPEMDLVADGLINSGDLGKAVALGVPRRDPVPPPPPPPSPAARSSIKWPSDPKSAYILSDTSSTISS